jgi:hypothetical protein
MNIEDLPPEIIYEIFGHLSTRDVDVCRKVNERWADIGDEIIQKLFDISHLGAKYRNLRAPKINYGNDDSTRNFNTYEDVITDLYKFNNDPVHDFQHKALIAETKGININDYYYEDRGVYDTDLCKNGRYRINMAKEIKQDDGSRAAYVKGVSNNPSYYSFIHRPICRLYPRQNYDEITKFGRSTSEIYEKPNEDIRAQYLNNTPKYDAIACDSNTNDKLDGELTRMMEIALFSDENPWY